MLASLPARALAGSLPALPFAPPPEACLRASSLGGARAPGWPDDTLVAPASKLPLLTPTSAPPRLRSGAPAASAGVPGTRRRHVRVRAPKPFSFVANIARDFGAAPRATFRRERVPLIAGVVSSTFILWGADQPITDAAQWLGRELHLKRASTQRTIVEVPIRYGHGHVLPLQFNAPDNLNSTFYFIGDGWTHFSITSGFWAYGLIGRDNRAAQTASQLAECIFVTGLATQAIKHVTGRESPYTTTYPARAVAPVSSTR